MTPSIRYGLSQEDAAAFWARMPEFARQYAICNLDGDAARQAFVERVASARLTAISGATCAWLECGYASGRVGNLHLASWDTGPRVIALGREFLAEAHKLVPYVLCLVPVCFRGAIACADALGFRKLCVVPQAGYLWTRKRYVGLRLAIHGQEA